MEDWESVKARLEKTLLAWPTNWQDEGDTKDAIRAALKRVEELERADKFVRILTAKAKGADISDYEEVLSNPEFWATDYAHALDKLGEVVAIEQRAEAAEAEVERLRAALQIIAGEKQCLDNLMSNVDVARAALATAQPEDAADVADTEITKALWDSRTDTAGGSDKGFVKVVMNAQPEEGWGYDTETGEEGKR